MTTFDKLMKSRLWVPIAKCPGRLVLTGGRTRVTPAEMIGRPLDSRRFKVSRARDTVVVSLFDGGGLISYLRDDGSYIHTLNTADGVNRKLADLGIDLQAEEPLEPTGGASLR